MDVLEHIGAYEAEYERLREELGCGHERTEIRERQVRNGTAFWHQCLRCGAAVGNAVARSTAVSLDAVAYPAPFDADLAAAWLREAETKRARMAELWQALRDEQALEWWLDYESYLQSAAWQDRRRRVLERDAYTCQACLRAPAVHVHHKTYRHVFNEPLFDLIAVCEPCHAALHPAQ